MGQILRVTKAFSVLSDPTGHVYTPGELVDASHPHVKGREGHFETVEAHVSARAGVEVATAVPGERRVRKLSAAGQRRAAAKGPGKTGLESADEQADEQADEPDGSED